MPYIHGLARHMTVPREAHVRALMMLTKYVVSTAKGGLLLAPKEKWSIRHKFKVHSRSDSDYPMNSSNRRSISGGRVFMNGMPIVFHSVTQKFVMLSMTKPKLQQELW
jgi:hypothetical protein